MVLPAAATSYPLLAMLVLLGSLGIPLPLTIALAAAGALAREGHASLSVLLVLCTGAAVGGDCLGYAIGRFGIIGVCTRARGRLCTRATRWLASPRMRAASTGGAHLRVGMGMLVFLTRWAVTAPSALVNLLAGMRRTRWAEFVVADVAGEAVWVVLTLCQGYLLGGSGSGMAPAIAGGALLALAIPPIVTILSRRTG
jgi:membrane protein DedA with SNARE-associated domain